MWKIRWFQIATSLLFSNQFIIFSQIVILMTYREKRCFWKCYFPCIFFMANFWKRQSRQPPKKAFLCIKNELFSKTKTFCGILKTTFWSSDRKYNACQFWQRSDKKPKTSSGWSKWNIENPENAKKEFKGLYFEGHVEKVIRKGQNLTISVSLSSELYPAQKPLGPGLKQVLSNNGTRDQDVT